MDISTNPHFIPTFSFSLHEKLSYLHVVNIGSRGVLLAHFEWANAKFPEAFK